MPKVLIVDDDPDLLEMVEMALSEQGFEVDTLDQGRLLFEHINSFKPEIILLDIYLKDADGRELCSQLKADPQYKHIPVALYSAGYITQSSVINAKANAFISKPFSIDELSEKIKEILTAKPVGKFRGTCLFILQSLTFYVYSRNTVKLVRT